MASEPDGDQHQGSDAVRRAAQDSASELARMGIDPRAVGLEPTGPPDRVSGRASPGAPPPAAVPPPPGPVPPPAAAVPPPPGPVPPPGAAPPAAGAWAAAAPPPAAPPPAAPPPAAPPSAAPSARGRASLPTQPGPATVPDSPRPRSAPPASPLAGTSAPPAAASSPSLTAAGRGPTMYGSRRPVPADPVDTTLSRPIGGSTRPAAAAPAADYLRPLAKVVLPPSMGASAALRRMARAVTLGVIEPGAAAAIEYERQLVARARLRRPEPRVIAFVAGKGGVGTTTTAAGVALTLATLRNDTTALACARTGASALGERLLGHPAPSVAAVLDGGQPQSPLWVHGSLAVIDGPPWHLPAEKELVVQLLDRLRGQHPLTIVDVGNDLGESAQAAIERADQVVLVTSASQDAVSSVQVALSRVHQADPFRLGTAVLALTCMNSRQYRRTVRQLRSELGMQAPRTVPIGFDPWLSAGGRIEPAQLRAATRESYLQIAGLIVEPGSHEQWFAQPAAPGAPPPAGHPGAARSASPQAGQ